MEGKRNDIEYILSIEAIVLLQHVEHRLFVTEETIQRQVVVDQLLI